MSVDCIEATRATISRQKAAVVRTEEITLEELLGEGTFGKVYKGKIAAAHSCGIALHPLLLGCLMGAVFEFANPCGEL